MNNTIAANRTFVALDLAAAAHRRRMARDMVDRRDRPLRDRMLANARWMIKEARDCRIIATRERNAQVYAQIAARLDEMGDTIRSDIFRNAERQLRQGTAKPKLGFLP